MEGYMPTKYFVLSQGRVVYSFIPQRYRTDGFYTMLQKRNELSKHLHQSWDKFGSCLNLCLILLMFKLVYDSAHV